MPDADEDMASRGAHPAGGTVTATASAQTTPYHQPVTDCIVNALVARLAKDADYEARRQAIAEWNAANPVLKRGIALTPVKFGISFTLTHLNQAGALVQVYQDGSILMNHGGTEMGQGLMRKVAQVAAARFGVSPDRVRISATDTAKVPNTSATAASSGSDLNGMAVAAACDTIRDRIAVLLAERAQARPEDVIFAEDRVRVGGDEMGFDAAVKLAYENRVSLSATGFYKTPDIAWDRIAGRGRPFYYFAYGAAVTEVAIDTLTGENRILRTDILHDVGTSLNPAVDSGPDRGRLCAGRRLADDRRAGLGRPGPAADARALDLQDPGLFRPAAACSTSTCGTAPTASRRCIARRPWASRPSCWGSRPSWRCPTPLRRRAAMAPIRPSTRRPRRNGILAAVTR